MINNDTKFFLLVNLFFFILILFFGEKIYSNILNQLFIFFIPIIWPGIAHGSLDILTATRKKLIIDSFTKFIFLILYLMIPLVFFFIWQIYPNYVFTVFLILSLMHFGISDKLKSKNLMVANEILLRSFIIISLPIVLHNEQTLEIFYFLNISEDYGFFLTEVFQYLVYTIIPLLILYTSNSLIKKEYGHLIDIITLLFCFFYFEPLLSFLIYFCFLHSVRHLVNEKKLLKLTNKKLLLNTIPMTLIVLSLLVFLIFIYFYIPNSIKALFINNVIISLFCLTISHVLLINFIKDK
jgi:Brp/Blh family beta-carotene 15,15'-monooxygenase